MASTRALFYSCWCDASGHAPVRNTAFLTSHTPTQIHTIPPQSSPLILDQALQAHTDIHTHTHKRTRRPWSKMFVGVQPRKPDVSSAGWVYSECVCVRVCTHMHAHTSLFWRLSGATTSWPMSGQQNHSPSSTKDSSLICSDFTSLTLHGMTPPPHVCTYCTFRWGSVCLNAFNYRIRLYESIQAVFSLFFFFNQLIGCTPSAACATQSELLYNSICSSSLASCAAKKGQKEIEWCTEVDGKHFRAVIYHISSCVFMSPPCVLYCTSQLPS